MTAQAAPVVPVAQLPVIQLTAKDLGIYDLSVFGDPMAMSPFSSEMSVRLPQFVAPGTRLVLRCDQVPRPYFPTVSYCEAGTIIKCDKRAHRGVHSAVFKHDPWPEELHLDLNIYLDVAHHGVTEFEIGSGEYLEVGDRAVISRRDSMAYFHRGFDMGPPVPDFYAWVEVLGKRTERDLFIYYVRVVPG
jgi:hypothetical protein